MFFCLSKALLTFCISLRLTAANETTMEHTKQSAVATITVFVILSKGMFLNLTKKLFELDINSCPSLNICHYNKMIN